MTNISDLKHWEILFKSWVTIKNSLDTAQAHIYRVMQDSLEGKGIAPTGWMQENVDDLSHLEQQARGLLDEFISERYSS